MDKRKLPVFCLLSVAIALAGIASAQAPDSAAAPARDPEKTVAMFIAHDMYREEQLIRTRDELSRAGYGVRLVSKDRSLAVGMDRTVVRPDLPLAELSADDFSALVLIGGSGAVMFWHDSLLHAKCEEFVEAGRVVASIGLATIILARAELLEGRRVTVYRERGAISIIREDQAHFVERGVVEDGNFITATGTEQAQDFGRAIARALDRRGR